MWLLGAGLVAAVVAATSIGAHAASSAVAIGFSEGSAGLMVAAGGAAGLAVRLAAGVRADRVSGGALTAAAVLCVMGAVGWLLMSTLWPLLFVVGLLAANAFGWGWPGLVHLAVARTFPRGNRRRQWHHTDRRGAGVAHRTAGYRLGRGQRRMGVGVGPGSRICLGRGRLDRTGSQTTDQRP
ncbi:MAG: hypothetical protein V9E98_15905 [Candidatus Nanopelagicales bacterium]